ncbi:uncharacterized protein LOC107998115 isoform X2 [Apis cerana]|nr:uncharacterized protein LOC107998115 isoform X2 [Apis cerana]
MVRTAFVYKRGSRYQGSADKNWTSVTSELPHSFESENMARIVSVLCIVCLVLTIVLAKPVPQQNNNGEVLAPKNTLYYPYAFWFVRPYYDQDDIDVGSFQLERRPSTISYANVGAGWGR